jgi:predicted dehydrogenase
MSAERVGVGVIGAGMISSYYLDNLTQFPDLNVIAIADRDPSRARAHAENHGLRALSVEELLDSSDIEIVLNLTVPAAHFDVSMQILASGKHVWSEKPLATGRHDAQVLLDEADRRGLRVACAPDTILGSPLQVAQQAVAAGKIGEPKSAIAIMQSPGPERVHPTPAFFYAKGAGPLLDTGPYYVTALVQTMGAIRRVRSTSSTALLTRHVVVGADAGREFPVRVPTQHMALLDFASGAAATLVTSFDSGIRRDLLELHGTEATLEVPNPSRFEGVCRIVSLREQAADLPPVGSTWGRGVGVLDLARSLREGVAERASGSLAFHVLDVLLGIEEAVHAEEPVTIASKVDPPVPLDKSWDPTAATL